jgi:hypothetical protein
MWSRVFIFVLFGLSYGRSCYAHKVALLTGVYSFTAKTSVSQATLSNWGAYSFEYLIPFQQQFDFHFGYTINMEGGISGDIAYGLDLGVHYYPFNKTSNTYFKTPTLSLVISEKLRPFVGLSFHQRQFQSIRTSYAGFGFSMGADYAMWKRTDLTSSLRFLSLKGPESSTSTLVEIFGGIVINF